MEWSALDSRERKQSDFPTAKAFAKAHGIGADRLSKWKQRTNFRKHRTEALRRKLDFETPEVLYSLMRRCKKYGRASDVEFWLLYVEGFDRQDTLKRIRERPPTLSPDDIRVLVSLLPEHKQQKFYEVLAELLAEAQSIRTQNEDM